MEFGTLGISVVDPKLFFSDPDPIFVRVLDPDSDPDPLWLVKSYGSIFFKCHNYQIAYFLMIFDKVHLLLRIRIRIHNLKLRIRIRILQKVSDPYGSGSTTLLGIHYSMLYVINVWKRNQAKSSLIIMCKIKSEL
jgi:hypothetical protein